jgi:thiol-disulfide isomerase/thioredoxin
LELSLMHLPFRRPADRRACQPLCLTFIALCLLLPFVACSSSGDATRTSADAGTPTGAAPPRTMYPMPPASSSTNASTNAQTFTLLDNRRMRVSDYLGQVVVIDFYATWCGPCRIETPHLVELHKRYGRQGLHIIGLNVGGAEDRYKVPAYVEEFGIPYTLGYPDPAMSSLYLSDDDRIPQAFVFDRKGRLIKRFISYDETMPAELDRIVQSALDAGAE